MITMSEAQHQELIRDLDGALSCHVEGRLGVTSRLVEIRGKLDKMAENTQRGRPLLLADFRNAVNALGHIDLDQMQALGFFTGARNADARKGTDEMIATGAWTRWTSFRNDPIKWLLHADDETQQKVWALVRVISEQPPGQPKEG